MEAHLPSSMFDVRCSEEWISPKKMTQSWRSLHDGGKLQSKATHDPVVNLAEHLDSTMHMFVSMFEKTFEIEK
ncbi:hypothetical protein DEO72_LG11g2480 [Vigna unguiculata]|uniref:Uncharacterized protein n=1 Tax=Vigna unguiculata TaxID=3917 RepID=A0A4D6NSJ0_VIGUN|nr:hypothetical protein DEO72_LG11g2479 [Vigna unguiculata]QCE15469.1 hypothetical protein DEO72_LG11g2480 [Vigna unguiculata]